MFGPSHDGPENFSNRILSSLPEDTLVRLRPHLRGVELNRSARINVSDGRIRDVYFVNRGSVAVRKIMQDGRTAQIRTIGIEGLTDPWVLFGVGGARLEAVVQIPGSASRIRRGILMQEMDRDPRLRAVLEAYARFAVGELIRTSACHCLHGLDARCCRLLLICHDNAMDDRFNLTHEHLASMLGVRRGGVTVAAGHLKRAGLVDYSRGRVTILDRQRLRKKACECYDEMRAELEEMLDSARMGVPRIG